MTEKKPNLFESYGQQDASLTCGLEGCFIETGPKLTEEQDNKESKN
ncbi:hypothetical protein [Streptococcus pantholopis]|nr:hypothetical protein [Streptococcus pantholopis]